MSDAESTEAPAQPAADASASEPSTAPDASIADVAFAEPSIEAAPGPASDPASEAAPGPSPADTLRAELDATKAEAHKFRDQLLRTAADFDNYRKRSRRDVDEASRKGKEQTVKDLLPIFDNLERALQSADAAPDAKSVADGLRMVLRQFASTLERMTIKRIPSVGHPFDPMLHEAIQHIESKEHPAGVIAAEVQAGYQLGEFLLRASMVVVSKGAPEPVAESEPAEGTPAPDA
jgi:molecular chaperone GrpE